MTRSQELAEQRDGFRTREGVTRALGAFSIGIAVLVDVGIGGNIANAGVSAVKDIALEAGFVSTILGPGLLSYAGSIGRRADVIDAELLRREQTPELAP
jgi:hypothetical protein